MRRSLLTVLIAGAVMPFAAEALSEIWTAFAAPSAGATVRAAGDGLRAAVAVWLAVTVLSQGDDPPRAHSPLYDWRALLARCLNLHDRVRGIPSIRREMR
jgi:hypothetical protein